MSPPQKTQRVDRAAFLAHIHALIAGETVDPCAALLPMDCYDDHGNYYGRAGLSFFVDTERTKQPTINYNDQAHGIEVPFSTPYWPATQTAWDTLHRMLDQAERIATEEGSEVEYYTNYMKMPRRAMTPPWES